MVYFMGFLDAHSTKPIAKAESGMEGAAIDNKWSVTDNRELL